MESTGERENGEKGGEQDERSRQQALLWRGAELWEEMREEEEAKR